MQLLEGCASRGQLLLGLCSTAPSNQPLSELAAGHRKPERTLQPGEGIDRGCELIAGSVMVSEAESRRLRALQVRTCSLKSGQHDVWIQP